MFRILVPVDGSENSSQAVRFLIKKAALYAQPLEIQLLNVQRPFPGTVRGVHEQAQQFHHDEGMQALAPARALLDEAALAYGYHIGLGEVGETIAEYAKEKQIDQIVMATHGRGAIIGLLMGSVTRSVLHLTTVPVLLVR
ncbi:MAG: universal stress protein [Betaproteobacteria bacterium]|nr:universal stress protein [Betaproteobacteria bacterium]